MAGKGLGEMDNESIVRLLQEKKPDFVSGEEIAHTAGVSRAAVWKKINLLRKKGYIIKGSPALGYRLTESPDLSIEEIKNSLSGHIGREIFFFECISSTNTAAMELASNGAAEGTVIMADAQTTGKGRLGRTWLSPAGQNLYISIILKPLIAPRDATMLTLMSAVACTSVIKNITSVPVSIKWPNDIMVSQRKLGGILTEIKADIDRILYAVVGIGININLEIDALPDNIRPIATSIKHETGSVQPRTPFVIEILKEMERWYNILLTAGKAPVIHEWLKLSSTIGRTVKVTAGNNIFKGLAESIDDDGMLMLRMTDNSLQRISAGDVTILR